MSSTARPLPCGLDAGRGGSVEGVVVILMVMMMGTRRCVGSRYKSGCWADGRCRGNTIRPVLFASTGKWGGTSWERMSFLPGQRMTSTHARPWQLRPCASLGRECLGLGRPNPDVWAGIGGKEESCKGLFSASEPGSGTGKKKERGGIKGKGERNRDSCVLLCYAVLRCLSQSEGG